MPWNRALYPKNWEQIALGIKEKANWTCQECGRPCRKPGQSWPVFVNWLLENHSDHESGWYWESSEVVKDDGDLEHREKPQRFCLTVAHLNHIPSDCRPENLKALCAPCHCRMDLKAMATKKRMKAERLGQLTLDLGGPNNAA